MFNTVINQQRTNRHSPRRGGNEM